MLLDRHAYQSLKRVCRIVAGVVKVLSVNRQRSKQFGQPWRLFLGDPGQLLGVYLPGNVLGREVESSHVFRIVAESMADEHDCRFNVNDIIFEVTSLVYACRVAENTGHDTACILELDHVGGAEVESVGAAFDEVFVDILLVLDRAKVYVFHQVKPRLSVIPRINAFDKARVEDGDACTN